MNNEQTLVQENDRLKNREIELAAALREILNIYNNFDSGYIDIPEIRKKIETVLNKIGAHT